MKRNYRLLIPETSHPQSRIRGSSSGRVPSITIPGVSTQQSAVPFVCPLHQVYPALMTTFSKKSAKETPPPPREWRYEIPKASSTPVISVGGGHPAKDDLSFDMGNDTTMDIPIQRKPSYCVL